MDVCRYQIFQACQVIWNGLFTLNIRSVRVRVWLWKQLTDLLANNKPREAVALFDKWKNGQVAGAPEFVPSLQSYNLYLLASARVVNSRLQTLLAAIIEMRSRVSIFFFLCNLRHEMRSREHTQELSLIALSYMTCWILVLHNTLYILLCVHENTVNRQLISLG